MTTYTTISHGGANNSKEFYRYGYDTLLQYVSNTIILEPVSQTVVLSLFCSKTMTFDVK